MKTKVYYLALIIAMLSVSNNAFSQSAKDIEVLKQRVKEKVVQLNDYISFMADPKMAQKTRFSYKSEAEKLFIEDCSPYTEIVHFVDGSQEKIQRTEGVCMEVASLRNQTPRPKPMKEYFRGLINMRYASVSIETTDIDDMLVSKLQPYGRDKDGNMMYVCTVHFEQVFHGITPEGRRYEDITRKYAVCYVGVEYPIDEKTGDVRPEYMVKLGDIHVESIERVR